MLIINATAKLNCHDVSSILSLTPGIFEYMTSFFQSRKNIELLYRCHVLHNLL